MQSYYSSTNAKPRRKLSSAMNKMRELVTPSASTSYKAVSADSRDSQTSAKLPESPSEPPFPTLQPNSKTMKNYAFQRSDKAPLRVPASFPTSLNFSQQTLYFFDVSDDEDDNSFSLDDILHEPTASINHGDGQQVKTQENKLKQRNFSLSGSNKKSRKFSFNALPVRKNIPFQLPSRTIIKKSQSTFFQHINASSLGLKLVSNEIIEPKVNNFKDVSEHESTTSEEYSQGFERKRLISLPTKLDNAYFNNLPELQLKDPRSLEDIPELSQPPTPALSFDYESTNMTSETSQLIEWECPQIDMLLTSSPLFNEGEATLTQVFKSTPTTPGFSRSIYGYQELSLNSLAGGPETPSTCVNSCSNNFPTTPHSKFLMSTHGSPGIYNLPTPCTKKTLVKRPLSLLSPHPIPSPLTGSTRHYATSRGPGPDMLATLDFLSELCQKSPHYLDENDSLFDHLSSDDSPES